MVDDILSTKKQHRNKKAGSFIICECGFAILLVPDLKAMSKAIEHHAAEHANKEKDIAKAAFEEERIQNLLIAQTLDKAATFWGFKLSVFGGKRNRDHLDLISEILEKCKKPKTRTGIMRSLNLSHKMLVSYLAELEYTKLIETPSNIPAKHITTQKGLEYLRKLRELQNIADFSAVNYDLGKDGSTKKDSKQIKAKDRKLKLN